MAYAEQNPLRAGMVREAGQYRWSPAEAHLRGEDPAGRLDLELWRTIHSAEQWRRVLASGVMEEDQRQRFREVTLSGRPFGTEGYVERLEEELGLTLVRRPLGHPRKVSNAAACSRAAPG